MLKKKEGICTAVPSEQHSAWVVRFVTVLPSVR